MNIYSLEWNQPGRRAGLTKGGYQAPSLLQSINAPKKQDTMRPRASQRSPEVKQKHGVGGSRAEEKLADEDIYAAPKSGSDDSSDEEALRGDIQRTQFVKRGSEEPKRQPLKGKGGSTRANKSSGPSANTSNSIRATRGSKRIDSPPPSIASSISSNNSKRKNEEDGTKFGSDGMADSFGRVKIKKPKTGRTYGSSSQMSHPKSSQPKSSQGSPQVRKSKAPEADPDGFSIPAFKKLDSLDLDSPTDSDTELPLKSTFKKVDTTEFDSPKKSGAELPLKATFRKVDTTEFDSPQKECGETLLKFRKPENLDFDDSFGQDESPLIGAASPSRPPSKISPTEDPPLTQLPAFKKFDMEEDLAEKAHDILEQDKSILRPISTQLDEYDYSRTQLALCPMCRKPVDPEELRGYGEMNTRQQEKFCRDHQRKDAKEGWSSKGYPEINWHTLDARISKHHSFIESLVGGADSHYREILNETVKAGKDRNLLKAETNLTPGYYGSRGLRVISENIMHEFTPLLKKRVVKDRLMAARGVTGFVQSVLVPEVTVLLIMEDMDIQVEEAREVLKDSIGMGELVNEEIRDVVVRRDSEDEDEADDG